MLKIVPDADASANPLVSLRFVEAFRAEVDERVGDGDFARREEVALALENEAVRAELTAALQDRGVARDGGRARRRRALPLP